jgi:hypothetical protein
MRRPHSRLPMLFCARARRAPVSRSRLLRHIIKMLDHPELYDAHCQRSCLSGLYASIVLCEATLLGCFLHRNEHCCGSENDVRPDIIVIVLHKTPGEEPSPLWNGSR